jgi:hypothetical protein
VLTLNVEDIFASSDFLINHVGFQQEMAADGLASMARDDAGMSLAFVAESSYSLRVAIRERTARALCSINASGRKAGDSAGFASAFKGCH